MNAMVIRGQMNQLRGGFRHGWCRMTGNRRGRINARMLQLFGRMQSRFGRTRAHTGKRFRTLIGH